MVAKDKKIKKARFAKTRREFWQNLFFSILLGSLFLLIIGALLVSNWKISQKRTEYNVQLVRLQEEFRVLEIKRQQLQAQISQTSDQEYLEEQAREKLNLKKPGEEVVTVLPAEQEPAKETTKGFWENVWDKIKFW